MRLLIRVVQGIIKACGALGGLIIFLMMVHICLDVAIRNLSSTPLTGTVEIVSSYYMVAACFLPLGLIELRGEQVFVEVFTQRLPQRAQQFMDFVARVATVAAFGAISVSSAIYAYDMTRRNEFLDLVYYDLPIWPSRWMVSIGFAVAALGAFCVALRTLTGHGASRFLQHGPSAEL
ncbi:TRAP transporter small permease [Roseixanthobacter glucoisosaccharinicivorans]|uniref:TRAP transporter small permease n=1 Tax=Roseixanthobacter glucoisosaccharinicivorans TaxID=3119923 RepID=UPI0037280A56